MSQEFEKFLYIRKGLQPMTVTGHVKAVERINRRIGELSRQNVENYVYSLYRSGHSYTDKSNQVKAIEYWFEFQGQELRFARQRKPKPIIKQTLSEAEINRLIFCCKNLREKAVVTMLAYSGLRPKELANLKVQDVDFGSNELRVICGKGMKDSVIYISAVCSRILLEYISKYQKNPDDFMFMTADGLRKFNQQCLRKLIKVLARRAHLTKRIYPYLLRHSLATNMIGRGANILLVKKQLRHAWIETTMLYIHSLGYSERNEYEAYVPSYT